MKKYWSKLTSVVLWNDKKFVAFSITLLVFMVLSWLLVAKVETKSGYIAWHYTVYFGIDRVGNWWNMLIYPLFLTIITLVNFFAAVGFYHDRRLFSYLILTISVTVQVVIIIQILALLWFVI